MSQLKRANSSRAAETANSPGSLSTVQFTWDHLIVTHIEDRFHTPMLTTSMPFDVVSFRLDMESDRWSHGLGSAVLALSATQRRVEACP